MTTNYTLFQSQFFNAVAAVSSDVTWNTEFPLVIDRAEQRCYRDLDMMAAKYEFIFAASLALIPQSRIQTIPSLNALFPSTAGGFIPVITAVPAFISIEKINVITPFGAVGSTAPVPGTSSGTSTPLTRQSPHFIDLCWPSDTTSPAPPQYYAILHDTTLMVGPPPDLAYAWRIFGAVRPLPLSSANSSTPLTLNYPDLFWAAAMVEAGMYMRFVEPAMSATWLTEYKDLMKSALTEEMRKRNWAEGWGSYQPSPVATPPRQ